MTLNIAKNLKQPGGGDSWSPDGYWKYRIDGIAGYAHIPVNWLPGSPPESIDLIPESKEWERS